jgi:hypothetical protein
VKFPDNNADKNLEVRKHAKGSQRTAINPYPDPLVEIEIRFPALGSDHPLI